MFRPVLAIIRLSRELKGQLYACVQLALKFPRQPDDGQYRPKHIVVSITVIKYTSVIKLCLTAYLFLVSHTHKTGMTHFLDPGLLLLLLDIKTELSFHERLYYMLSTRTGSKHLFIPQFLTTGPQRLLKRAPRRERHTAFSFKRHYILFLYDIQQLHITFDKIMQPL